MLLGAIWCFGSPRMHTHCVQGGIVIISHDGSQYQISSYISSRYLVMITVNVPLY